MASNQQRIRDLIEFLYVNCDFDHGKIADICGCSLSTVYRTIKRLQTSGNTARKPGSGPICKLSPKDIRKACTILAKDSEKTISQLTNRLIELGCQRIHRTTLNKALLKYGYKSIRPRMVPLLTDQHKQRRLEWCHRYKDHDWSSTFFSDESSFQTFSNYRKVRTKVKATAARPKFPVKVMVWGAISMLGQTPLYFVPKTMNSEVYIETIEFYYLRTARELYPDGFGLVQDNATCHRSKITRDFFRITGVKAIEWPANSPDLNPIENIWGIIKQSLNSKKTENKTTLVSSITKIWDNLDPNLLINLVESMPRRINACIEANGGRTKY